jgi:predicted amidohydrolase
VTIQAGSIPEIADGKVYNTAVAISRDGVVLEKHRKVLKAREYFC